MSKPLFLAVKDRTQLYECYMPFLKDGGLFIPTDAHHALGEAVWVLLDLMHEPEPERVAGTVVWITPKGAQRNRPAGIGVRFGAEGDALRRRIETYLAGALGSQRRTHTL